jgi:hypothetical protein
MGRWECVAACECGGRWIDGQGGGPGTIVVRRIGSQGRGTWRKRLKGGRGLVVVVDSVRVVDLRRARLR